jgi:acyl carrier protein
VSKQEIAARVETTFGSVFGGKLPFNAELERAGTAYWTSLKHMEFLMALEGEFGVRFDGADAVDMQSIPTVVERVAERLA